MLMNKSKKAPEKRILGPIGYRRWDNVTATRGLTHFIGGDLPWTPKLRYIIAKLPVGTAEREEYFCFNTSHSTSRTTPRV